MTDEQMLHERLTAVAAEQDDLLPRALSDDLAAGRRRLRRRQVLAGGGAVGAVAMVGVLALGVTSWLTPNVGTSRSGLPVAGQVSAPASTPAPTERPGVPAPDPAFDQLMKTTLAAHVDPAKQHLDFSSGPFLMDRQPAVMTGGGRVGWRMPGQAGEGVIGLSLRRTPYKCGAFTEPRLTCHSVKLPNGRTAQLGRQGDTAHVTYRQPDGEYVSATVGPLFANNTTTPVHDMGITDAQLLALVQDPKLNLPPMTDSEKSKEQKMKGFKPSPQELSAAARRVLTGATVTSSYVENVPEDIAVYLNWRRGSIAETVEVGVDSSATVSTCQEQIGVHCEQLVLPDGRKVMYGEGAIIPSAGTPRQIRGATFIQPDGDSAFVRITYKAATAHSDGVSKDQILALLTDPTLDK
jgi:hypothetical protein